MIVVALVVEDDLVGVTDDSQVCLLCSCMSARMMLQTVYSYAPGIGARCVIPALGSGLRLNLRTEHITMTEAQSDDRRSISLTVSSL